MSDVAEFIVRLVDKVSAPARRASGALRRLDKSLDALKNTAAFQALDNAGNHVLSAARKVATAVAVLGAAAGAYIVKRTVEMGAFLERARAGLTALGGSASAGAAALNSAVGFARDFGFQVEDAVGSMLKLRAAQFSLGESEQIMRLGADLRAIGTDAEGVKRAIIAITQIKAKGRLQSEELVGQLAEAGVATTLVYKHLATQLGKSEAQVRSLLQAGKITADQGIEAIKTAVLQKVGGTRLGEVGKRIAQETLGGALDRLKAAPGLFLARVASAMKPALGRLTQAINTVIADIGFTDTSPIVGFVTAVLEMLPAAVSLAKEFAAGFGEGFRDVLESMRSVTGPSEDTKQLLRDLGVITAKFFGALITGAKLAASALVFLTTPLGQFTAGLVFWTLLIPKLISFGDGLSKAYKFLADPDFQRGMLKAFSPLWTLLRGIGTVVAGFVTSVGILPIAIGAALIAAGVAIYYWWDDIAAFFERGVSWWTDLGGRLVEGLVNGIKGGVGWVVEAITGLADRIKTGIKNALGIASPSKVMRKFGAFTGEGFALGLEDRRARVEQASRQSLEPGPAMQHITNSSSSRSSVHIGAIHIAAPASGRPQDFARLIAAEVQRALRGMGESPAGA